MEEEFNGISINFEPTMKVVENGLKKPKQIHFAWLKIDNPDWISLLYVDDLIIPVFITVFQKLLKSDNHPFLNLGW